MKKVISLYTSMDGRIGRKTWWLATTALMMVWFAILVPISLAHLADLTDLQEHLGTDAAAASMAFAKITSRQHWLNLIAYVISVVPLTALCVKRRHDRNNSGRDVMVVYALYFIFGIINLLGIGYVAKDLGNGVMVPQPSLYLIIASAPVAIYGLYLFVLMGFFKGTDGANEYGSDPRKLAAR